MVLTTDSDLLPWSRAVVVDMDGGATVYPARTAHAILTRGYWEQITDPELAAKAEAAAKRQC